MIAWVAAALAQTPAGAPVELAFPSTQADYLEFRPTAYRDHGEDGYLVDWDCAGRTYARHLGSDFGGGGFQGMEEGRDVAAAAAGVVVSTNDGEFDLCTTLDCEGGGGFGNFVVLEHADGRITTYAHLKQWSVAVSVGDAVVCGQLLGLMGSSGYSTGPHIHFQLEPWGEDPFAGDCSPDAGAWVEQGAWGELPGIRCPDAPPCAPVAELRCGDVVTARSDGPGSTSRGWQYVPDGFVYPGAEVAWTLRADGPGVVVVRMTGMTDDLDLYALATDACDGTGAVAWSTRAEDSDEELRLTAAAGAAWTLVADGWSGAASDLTLRVTCEDAPEPEGEPGPSGPSGSAGEPTGTPDPRPAARGGCTMAGSRTAPGGIAIALLVLRRRRKCC